MQMVLVQVLMGMQPILKLPQLLMEEMIPKLRKLGTLLGIMLLQLILEMILGLLQLMLVQLVERLLGLRESLCCSY